MSHTNNTDSSVSNISLENQSNHNDSANLAAAVSATIHYLVGCSIGEFLGLFIGVSLGLSIPAIQFLNTILAFISGFLLMLIPIMKFRKIGLNAVLKIIWLGDDRFHKRYGVYHEPGCLFCGWNEHRFCFSFDILVGVFVSLSAGFIAAFPRKLLDDSSKYKKCRNRLWFKGSRFSG